MRKLAMANPHKNKHLVTCALPYANGAIHIGHLLEYIQADIWVRYWRLRGVETLFFCADDTHGTPIMIRARAEGISPEALIERTWYEHVADFAAFGIRFDHYHSTHSRENRDLATEIFQRLQEHGHVVSREVDLAFCPVDEMFLPDRYIKGTCPYCGTPDQYGDSCDHCARTYTPRDLPNPVCAQCGWKPDWIPSTHLFLRVSNFEPALRDWLNAGHVQEQVVNLLAEWFRAGLRDWDISRDAPYFGFEIPGYPGKYFYVWLDAPVGYMATVLAWCREHGREFTEVWQNGEYRIVHFIGKDIVYFHALFWPALLMGSGFRTPDELAVHGFLTVNGQKMSKSRGTFLTARTYLNHLDPQYLRFYYAAKLGPRLDDLDLQLDEFVQRVNADLVNTIVNIPSRVIPLLHRYGGGRLGTMDGEGRALVEAIQARCETIGDLYEQREFSQVVRTLVRLASDINVYLHQQEPWRAGATDPVRAISACTAALNAFKCVALVLQPVLPHLSAEVARMMGVEEFTWADIDVVLEEHPIAPFTRLMERVDPRRVEAMVATSAPDDEPPLS
jgi:methionyl-tRNA synthetase